MDFPHVTYGAARIRQGQWIGAIISSIAADIAGSGTVSIEYDDGTYDEINLNLKSLGNPGLPTVVADKAAALNGWVVGLNLALTRSAGTGAFPRRSVYAQVFVSKQQQATGTSIVNVIAQGYVEASQLLQIGQFTPEEFGSTWVFQGTIAEDATVGTHGCSLTISPGAGNALEVIGGNILVGNTATAQTAIVQVEDASGNEIYDLLNPDNQSNTVAQARYAFPNSSQNFATIGTLADSVAASWGAFKVSGTMQLILKVTTAAVSVTHTFSIACRILNNSILPTATLADSVGTPTLTTNTNAVF